MSKLLSNRIALAIGGGLLVVIVAWLFAYEPVTRTFVFRDALCAYCHLPQEYESTARLAFSQPHKATPEGGQAACVDCHLPKGFWPTTYAYTHLLSVTDLFGGFRDREGERAGDWVPLSAARAARVRNRLFETDSATCRSCHIESEIKPKRARGKQAHEKARADNSTCIECHYNLVHREVELPKTAFRKPAAKDGDRERKP